MMKKNSLAFQIWKYLILFSGAILAFLWLFQVVLLDHYYEWSKTEESKKIAEYLSKEEISKDNIERIAYEEDVCIELATNEDTIY